MYMMCAENASLFPWFSLMIAWTTRLFFLLVFIYVRAKRWLCNYSGAKGKSVVTQLAPIGFYNDHLRQIFFCLPPVERWSFISLHHALSLLYCTLWLTRLFSDSKDFSRAFFFCILFKSVWLPRVFDLSDWHLPTLLTSGLRFDWSTMLFRLRNFFPCLSLWLAFWLVYSVLCRQNDWFLSCFALRQTWLMDTQREVAKL